MRMRDDDHEDERDADDAETADDAPGPGPQTPEGKAFRARVLMDEKTIGGIKKVLRAKGVPEHELEDVVAEVREKAYLAPNFPEDSEDEARTYANGVARNHARKRARTLKRRPETTTLDGMPDAVPAQGGASHEDRDLVHKATERALAKNPRKVELYLRSEVHGESQVELATEAGLSGGRMRSYVGEGRKTMRGELRALLGVAIILVTIGFVALWQKRNDDGVTHAPPHRPDATELRARAREECAASKWRACADHLHQANDVDPSGETEELRTLRLSAEEHAREPP
jgi:DNA-directed RNA polymerase specialized sigma24 family protein